MQVWMRFVDRGGCVSNFSVDLELEMGWFLGIRNVLTDCGNLFIVLSKCLNT
jgi:hypothetical protein